MHKKTSSPLPTLEVLITISAAAERTGLTEKAIRRKIENGVWLQGHEYNRAPDGRLYIDAQAVARWQRGMRRS